MTRRLLTLGLVLSALTATGCGTVTSIVSALADEWSDGVVLEGERAVVAADAEPLGPSSRLHGHALLVDCGGVLTPAICIGDDADVCSGLRERDALVIQRAHWRNGRVKVGGESHDGLYLEISKAHRPIGR
ncbi:MAG: hypothetical protein AAGC60_00145 [Acidobacteriota bacterium]